MPNGVGVKATCVDGVTPSHRDIRNFLLLFIYISCGYFGFHTFVFTSLNFSTMLVGTTLIHLLGIINV